MRVLSKAELLEQARIIGTDGFCANISEIARGHLDLLRPPQDITTLEYSEKHRLIRKPDGSKTPWKRDLTPYLVPIMDALDNPKVREVIVPKPARSGGTVVAENYALKMFEFGPRGDVLWYLAGPNEVKSYSQNVFSPMFEDHVNIAAKITARVGTTGNTATAKRVGGQNIELLAMGQKTTTNRQAYFIVTDEPDSYSKDFRSNFIDQARQRQKMLGQNRKIYACAHADAGWSGGISQGWLQSSRGIYVMPCAECNEWASPYPTKHWRDIPRYRLYYEMSAPKTPIGERLKRAERTAAMACPNCGALLNDEQRHGMIDKGAYMHEGQHLDVSIGIIGDPDDNVTMGFWVHVLMTKQANLPELARDLEAAREHYERTRKTDKIKQVIVRTFGEVFEGAGEAVGLDAESLRKRSKATGEAMPESYHMGEVPEGVRFITATVDVGGKCFDVLLRGFDLEGRSWLLDRFTIKQRLHPDGVMRDIKPSRVQEDWSVLESQVIDRLLPMKADPSMVMPVAVTLIDSGDGNVTWKAYEFARRMDAKRWMNWRKVYCVKGIGGDKQPHLSPNPKTISTDADGKPVDPVIKLQLLGVDSLKDDVREYLAIEDGSPGQCYFAVDTPEDAFAEFFGETKEGGKWVRTGDNETFDLYGYSDAAVLMLEPNRKDRNWSEAGKEPIWARPISLEPKGGDPADEARGKEAPKPKQNIMAQLAGLNR